MEGILTLRKFDEANDLASPTGVSSGYWRALLLQRRDVRGGGRLDARGAARSAEPAQADQRRGRQASADLAAPGSPPAFAAAAPAPAPATPDTAAASAAQRTPPQLLQRRSGL